MEKEYRMKKQKTVGIPRGLIYYHYPILFQTFFDKLGAKVILSKESNRTMLLEALKISSDEECFSGKVFFGHILDLVGKVDYIFLPKYHGSHKYKVNCPKFIGLPDVIKAVFSDLPQIINPYHSRTKKRHRKLHLFLTIYKTGLTFTKNPIKILRAMNLAIKAHNDYLMKKHYTEEELHKWEYNKQNNNNLEKVKVALLGHGYVLEDPILSFDTKNRLEKMGVEVITSEEMPKSIIDNQMEKLHSVLYFHEECQIVGTALYFLETETVDGILQLIPFPCGPTAVSSEIIMRHAKRNDNMPLIQLMVDDNTGEAGFVTRLEAFVMTMRRKKLIQYRKDLEQNKLGIRSVIAKSHEMPIDEEGISG
jgi:predicted nucleotide-binding protein (sugar kinase/HSP70/actin superfamily)